MSDQPLLSNIEALLFTLGGAVSKKELAQKLTVSPQEIEAAVPALVRAREGSGIVVVDDGRFIELRTAPSAAELVERVRKEEFAREVGRAGLEALAAVLYRGPLTRAEIDFIRGVNSSQTLRTLAMRGLVRKVQNPKDERSLLYEPTTELLAYLGVTHIRDLPHYEQVRAQLQSLEEAYRLKETVEQSQ